MKMALIVAVAVAAASLAQISYATEWWPGMDSNLSLSLNGDNPIRVVQSTSFTDPGATCVEDGVSITVYAGETVDTSTTGTTVLNYTCGSGDNALTVNREVIVYNTPPDMTVVYSNLYINYTPIDIRNADQLGPDCNDTQDGHIEHTTTSTTSSTGNATSATTYTFTCTDSVGLTDTATGRLHHPK